MFATRPGTRPDMEGTRQDMVNDQAGESGPGVIEQTEQGERAEHAKEGDIPVSPTPEPPETAPEAEEADTDSDAGR